MFLSISRQYIEMAQDAKSPIKFLCCCGPPHCSMVKVKKIQQNMFRLSLFSQIKWFNILFYKAI